MDNCIPSSWHTRIHVHLAQPPNRFRLPKEWKTLGTTQSRDFRRAFKFNNELCFATSEKYSNTSFHRHPRSFLSAAGQRRQINIQRTKRNLFPRWCCFHKMNTYTLYTYIHPPQRRFLSCHLPMTLLRDVRTFFRVSLYVYSACPLRFKAPEIPETRIIYWKQVQFVLIWKRSFG